MASIRIHLRRSSKSGSHKGSVYLRMLHNGKARTRTLPYKLYPYEWDFNKNTVIIATDIPLWRKNYLEEVRQSLAHIAYGLRDSIDHMETGGRFSVEDISEALNMQCSPGGIEAYADHLSRQLVRLGRERTAEAYRTVVRGLILFNEKKDICLSQITSQLIEDFERYLKSSGKSLNTISFYMRNLRSIYNKAIADRQILRPERCPFSSVFTGVAKTVKRALSLQEMKHFDALPYAKRLDAADFNKLNRDNTKKRRGDYALYTSWRYFMFCFHARGMSFVDMCYLKKENIKDETIRYYRRKTGHLIQMGLTPVLKRIIDSFGKETKNSSYVFPILTDIGQNNSILRKQYLYALRRQNRLLKELSHKAGIAKGISTHVSRHSWASIAKEEDLPVWVISEGLGHTSQKTTYNYLASFGIQVLDTANRRVSHAVSSRYYPTG